MQIKFKYTKGGEAFLLEGDISVSDVTVSIWAETEEDSPGIRTRVYIETSQPITLIGCAITIPKPYALSERMICNGFQSWSETREYHADERQKGLRKIARPLMLPYGDYSFYKYPEEEGVLRSWLYTYIKKPGQKIRFYGALNDHDAYSCFQHRVKESTLALIKDLAGWEVNGKILLADWWEAETSEAAAFSHWYTLLDVPPLKDKAAIGWTSWYHYYTGISESIMLKNLDAFTKEKIPLDFFQLDDGYQAAVGDWLKVNSKFPSGMRSLTEKIRAAGYRPGIWLAPLAAERKSALFKEHPDWIVKDKKGKPHRIGYNPLWSGAFYALDIYHEEVRAYLRQVFDVVLNDWNFDMVKLDFLYGAALIPRQGKSRGRIMRETMDFLRECVGDKLILGCGVPLASALHTTDYCRIGQDIHLDWEFGILKWCRNGERVSTYLALTNTIHRRQLNGRFFWNDPDVFMLRKKKQMLNANEQYSLLLVNLLFGDLLFTSDYIGDYDEATMRLYKSIFPLFKRKEIRVEQGNDFYKVSFRVNEQYYTALINLSNTPQAYKLGKGLFFNNRHNELLSGDQLLTLRPHQSICLMHIGFTPFALAGTRGHFFAGSEVESLYLDGNDIKVTISEKLLTRPEIYVRVPLEAEINTINGNPVKRVAKKDFAICSVQL
jgi:alpha-galactosidase